MQGGVGDRVLRVVLEHKETKLLGVDAALKTDRVLDTLDAILPNVGQLALLEVIDVEHGPHIERDRLLLAELGDVEFDDGDPCVVSHLPNLHKDGRRVLEDGGVGRGGVGGGRWSHQSNAGKRGTSSAPSRRNCDEWTSSPDCVCAPWMVPTTWRRRPYEQRVMERGAQPTCERLLGR